MSKPTDRGPSSYLLNAIWLAQLGIEGRVIGGPGVVAVIFNPTPAANDEKG